VAPFVAHGFAWSVLGPLEVLPHAAQTETTRTIDGCV
jgi:hypothetical protein